MFLRLAVLVILVIIVKGVRDSFLYSPWLLSFNFAARPLAPENGLIKVDGILKVGRLVKFHCKSGFMMEGQPVMTCSETTEDGLHVGKWTGEIPTCVRACTYPGKVARSIIRLYLYLEAKLFHQSDFELDVWSSSKDLSEMKSTKVFSVFCYIKLMSWNLLFIWFLPPHETVKTQ